ncbi:MAG: hypothetical protein HP028_01875 [Clostridia bacterium]|jgi:hypothetical protein|nr:hypothetical protein [Clostridia bacterium]
MENKKEGILKKFWSKLKNFWNNLGIDVEDYKFTDEGFQKEINNRGMDEQYKALQYNSADNCAVNVANRGKHRASEENFKNEQHISGHIVKNENKTGIAYENERE